MLRRVGTAVGDGPLDRRPACGTRPRVGDRAAAERRIHPAGRRRARVRGLRVRRVHPYGGRTDLVRGVTAPTGHRPRRPAAVPRRAAGAVAVAAGAAVDVVLRQRIAPGLAHTVSTTLGHRPPGPDGDGQIARPPRWRPRRTSRSWSWARRSRSSRKASTARPCPCRDGRTSWSVRVAAANRRTIVVVNAGCAGADAVGGRRGGDPADLVPRPGAGRRWPTCCSGWPSRAAAADDVAAARTRLPVLSVTPTDGALAYDGVSSSATGPGNGRVRCRCSASATATATPPGRTSR